MLCSAVLVEWLLLKPCCVEVVRLYSVVGIVVMSGEVACCSVVCGTLVGVSVFSTMCSELLISADLYSPFSDSVGLPLHNILSPFLSVMDIFFIYLKFCHIRFYTP